MKSEGLARRLKAMALLAIPTSFIAVTMSFALVAGEAKGRGFSAQLQEESQPGTADKDFWDKLAAMSGIIQGLSVAAIGAMAGLVYNRTQLSIERRHHAFEEQAKRTEITVQLVPYLISSESKERELALKVLSYLGDESLVSDLSSDFREAGAEALTTIESLGLVSIRESIRITNLISSTDSAPDVVTNETLTLNTGTRPLSWRKFSIGATGSSEPHTSFAEIDFRVSVDPRWGGRLRFEPILEGLDTHMTGMVRFEPPLRPNESVRWTYSFSWTGLWRELRRSGRDSGFYIATGTIDLEELMICWQLSSGRGIRLANVSPQVGNIRAPDALSVCWQTEAPQGTYNFDLAADW